MKPRKIKPYGPTYKRERAQLAIQYVPEIRPCRDCGHPVVVGYCCTFCGSYGCVNKDLHWCRICDASTAPLNEPVPHMYDCPVAEYNEVVK